jgi:AbrB family looped-hinge helix DNA binding protein
MEAIVSSKGQVTIPVAVRKKLKMHNGSRLLFNFKADTVIVSVKPTFSSYYGKFSGFAEGKDPAAEINGWRARGKKS